MKSKIEKLNQNLSTVQDRQKELYMKVDQIIDHLNSQSQPEEKPVYVAFMGEEIVAGTNESVEKYRRDTEDFLKGKDTPEEIDNTKLVMPPSAYEQAEKEGFDMRNKVKSELLPEDTPEEFTEGELQMIHFWSCLAWRTGILDITEVEQKLFDKIESKLNKKKK